MTTHERRHITPQAARQRTLSTEPWLGCEDCFTLMDVHVETILADPDSADLPEMGVHLSGCTACAEETVSLLLLVAAQDGLDPATARRRLG